MSFVETFLDNTLLFDSPVRHFVLLSWSLMGKLTYPKCLSTLAMRNFRECFKVNFKVVGRIWEEKGQFVFEMAFTAVEYK